VHSASTERILIVGAGTMGHQIALQCAINNKVVYLVDAYQEPLTRAQKNIETILKGMLNRKEINFDSFERAQTRIFYDTSFENTASEIDFVIEAVYENLNIKRKVFINLDQLCPPHTVLASNTSSLKPSLIAEVTGRREKVLCMNFENPVWEYPMVELMGSKDTSIESMEKARKLVKSIGLVPLVVKKEITGFVMNRIWRAIKKEALFLADNGYASFEDIDRAFMIQQGSSSGPFMIMDRVGLDVIKDIEEVYYQESRDESDKPPKILVEKVELGNLGVKTGLGFYCYPNPSYQKPGWLKGVNSPNRE
jgi:3-hydroxybutyryl-CoA dehydrogenase